MYEATPHDGVLLDTASKRSTKCWAIGARMSDRTVAKDVSLIAITSVLTSLGAFFLLPVITKSLDVYDYGVWAQISVMVSLLSSIASLGLSMVLVRFLAAETDLHRINEGFYSIAIIVALSGLVASLIVFSLADIIAVTLFNNIGTSQFIKVGSFLILLTAINQIELFYFQIFRQIRTYALNMLFSTFGRLALIFTLLHAGFGLMGVIAADLIIHIAVFLVAIVCIINHIGFIVPKFTMIKEYLSYGLPLAPISLVRWITDSSGRFIIGIFLGMNDVGVYSAAYSIGSLVLLFANPIQSILFPELSKLYDEGRLDDIKIYLSNSIKYFSLFCIPSVAGLSILSPVILEILTRPEFASGSLVIPIVALAGLMGGVFQIIINITHLVKRTQFNLFIHLIAASANVLLNVMLIPVMGIFGAAVATFISYLLMVIAVFYVSFKHISFKIDWLFIIKSILSSVLMIGLISIIYPEDATDLLIAIVCGAIAYFVIITALGGFDTSEIETLKKQIFRLRNHILSIKKRLTK